MTAPFLENPLDDVAVRALGSLVEKAATTPDNYPLTLNALTAACNQTSNRDPVLQLDEAAVLQAVEELKKRSLVSEVYRSDSRARRYRHLLAESLKLHPAEIAVLGVLMLRGPQTPGELRTRTVRMYQFEDLRRLEITLDALRTMSEPLVTELPRRPGQKEVRFAHLLGGAPSTEGGEPPQPEAAAQVDRIGALEQDVASLREELAALRAQFEEFRREFL